MPELAVTVRASRTVGIPVVAGPFVASALSRCLRLLLARAQAEERERIARDLHDGAQQRLVHTVLALKLAQKVLDAGEARALVDEALEEAQAAHAELRELARGVRPPVLSRGGLEAGVRALAERAPVPVNVDICVGRLPARVEAAAYFVVAEALTNVAKHAQAGAARVTADRAGGVLHVEVTDDGVGGADPNGNGLAGLSDRVTALGGELEVTSARGGGTRIALVIPLPR
jgi:signal transduction histidine kinase